MYLPGPPASNHSTYGARLLQSGLMIVYITFWIWSAMQSSPENPGIIELSTLFDSPSTYEGEEDRMKDMPMTCRHYNSRLAENGLLLSACLMMLAVLRWVPLQSGFCPVKEARAHGKSSLDMTGDFILLFSNQGTAVWLRTKRQLL